MRVTGGVVVKGPQDGFQTDTSGMALFSGGLEPFGLAALDAPEDFAEEEQSDEEGEKLQLSDLLSGGDEESLTDLLPEEEKAGAGAAAGEQESELWHEPDTTSALEDELQNGAAYAV